MKPHHLSSATPIPIRVTVYLQVALSDCQADCTHRRHAGSSLYVRRSTESFLVCSPLSPLLPTALPWPERQWSHHSDSHLLFAVTSLTCFDELSWAIWTGGTSVCPWCLVTISNLDFFFTLFLSFLLFNLKVNPSQFKQTQITPPNKSLPLSTPTPKSHCQQLFPSRWFPMFI